MENKKKFDDLICYIESTIYSKEFEALTPKEQSIKMKEVLNLKLMEVYKQGIRMGENNIKSQLEKLNYTKSENI